MSFVESMTTEITLMQKNIEKDVKGVVYEMAKRVVDRTPLFFESYDSTGNTKWNWRASIGAVNTNYFQGKDRNGTKTLNKIKRVIDEWDKGDLYIANPVPWIWKLEDGGYPANVVRGSYDKVNKVWEIRSTGGWSNQLISKAPNGMVKTTLSEFNMLMAEANKGI